MEKLKEWLTGLGIDQSNADFSAVEMDLKKPEGSFKSRAKEIKEKYNHVFVFKSKEREHINWGMYNLVNRIEFLRKNAI